MLMDLTQTGIMKVKISITDKISWVKKPYDECKQDFSASISESTFYITSTLGDVHKCFIHTRTQVLWSPKFEEYVLKVGTPHFLTLEILRGFLIC